MKKYRTDPITRFGFAKYSSISGDEQSSGVRWRKYTAKFENLLCSLDVHDDARNKALLLHHIGDEAYDIFDSFSDEQKGIGSVNVEGEANEYETLKHSFTPTSH